MLLDKLLFNDVTRPLLQKGMNLSAERHLLISANIGNADTPGYKAVDLDFSKEMQEAMGGGDHLNPQTTNSKHIGPANAKGEPEVREESDAARSNGNNVNMDKEMAKLAENQVMYNAIAQILTKRMSMIRSAVTESALQ